MGIIGNYAGDPCFQNLFQHPQFIGGFVRVLDLLIAENISHFFEGCGQIVDALGAKGKESIHLLSGLAEQLHFRRASRGPVSDGF